MTKRGSRRIVAAAVLMSAFGLAPMSLGQPEQLLEEAVQLHDRGRFDEALAKLEQLVAADPSSEVAFDLINSIEGKRWAKMMTRSGRHAAVIKQLFDLSIPAQNAVSKDPDAIKALLARLDGDDWADKVEARRTLAGSHGEYAVPHMLSRLGSADAGFRARYIEELRRLGVLGTLPLIQALELGDESQRAAVATALGLVGDPRAMPYLASAAKGSGMMADAARTALGDRAGSVQTDQQIIGRYVQLAEAFYRNDPEFVIPSGGAAVVWAAEGDGLVAREVPRSLYHLKLAEEVAYDALAMDPGHEESRVLLAAILFAEEAAAEVQEEPNAAAGAGRLGAAFGPAVLHGVVERSMADGRTDVAIRAIRLLGDTVSADTFNGGGSLTAALGSRHKAVRYEAALALQKIGPRGYFAGRESIVPTLGAALGEDAIRTAVVIDDRPDTRNSIVGELNGRGWFARGANAGSIGLATLRELPIEDLAIIRYNLEDATVSTLIRAVRQDPMTAELPVFLLCDPSDREAAENQYGDRVQGFIDTPPSADVYEPTVRAALKSLDAGREEATMVAARAASSLAHMDPKGDMAPAAAQGALLGTLKGDDRVRIPAMAALGSYGDARVIAPLLELFGDSSASEAARGAAAVALGHVTSRTGFASPEVLGAMKEAAGSEGSPEFHQAIGKAFGLMPAGAAAQMDLLRALRSSIHVDLDGE